MCSDFSPRFHRHTRRAAAPRGLARSVRPAPLHRHPRQDRGPDADSRCALENFVGAPSPGSGPIKTAPPAPFSIRATRRRMRARMIFSPSSASAMMSLRSPSGGMRRASMSIFARASTSAGRPDSCPISARNWPGPSSTIGTTWPKPSRELTATVPTMSTNMPGLGYDESQKATRLIHAVQKSSQSAANSTSIQSPVVNAGLSHSMSDGSFIPGDLCPSRKPVDRDLLEVVKKIGPDTPVALAISGLWLMRHGADFQWLKEQERSGTLEITWVNHSYHHPYVSGRPVANNFLLMPGFDMQSE